MGEGMRKVSMKRSYLNASCKTGSSFPFFCIVKETLTTDLVTSGFVQVLENLESPGILLWHFPGLESPGKRSLVLESSGNLLNSAKKYEVYGRR